MYIILWEFEVALDKVEEFVAAYDGEGDWARLFRQADGFRGTRLLRSTDGPARFVTIDTWEDVLCFERFRERFADDYRALDERFATLTLSERKLGTFTEGRSPRP
jgi:heme-degrading monooxygenase HmoA